MRKAIALTHIAFEDLGTLEGELQHAGYAVETVDACTTDLASLKKSSPDLLVVLGGPIGVYESDTYPFLEPEIDLLRTRLADKKPTIGICLGAQLLAAAAGSNVYPGTQGKEIGWEPIQPGSDIALYLEFVPLCSPELRVLHWHGDTFDLPPGAHHLARTNRYTNQAFAIEQHTLGLQFHPEIVEKNLERWYVGHTCELGAANVSIAGLRKDAHNFAPALEKASRQFWRSWLARL